MKMVANFPRLETERMILRGPLESDYPAVAAFMASERATYVGGPIDDEFATWRAFLAVMGHWTLRGYGFFTLEHRQTAEIIGRAGIVNHIMWPEPELGWHLFDGYEGQGYAFEAAIEIRKWAEETLGLGPLISLIVPENTRSVRLAERLGARAESQVELMGTTGVVYRHPDLSAESAA